MSYVTKNYTTDGGDKTVIGGSLVFEEGASVEGLPSPESSFTPAENQAESEATTIAGLKEDFNSLLKKLKAAGLMEVDEESPEEPAEPEE